MNKAYRNKVLGSMIGGAIGDALGYPVEFISYEQILRKYGGKGITRYELNNHGVAEISDDTQMSLFTANEVLYCFTRYETYGGLGASPADYMRNSYIEWLQTQTGEIDYTEWHFNWIRDIKELHANRAPGKTCLTAIQDMANHKEVVNNSKGCGGIMRVAPFALYTANPAYTNLSHADIVTYTREAGKIAALTHKHPPGYIPAAFLSALIQRLMPYSYINSYQLCQCIRSCITIIAEIYPEHQSAVDDINKLVNKAITLSIGDRSDAEAIAELGEGWVAEETLAIALYCVLKYYDDFEKAIVASVNHSGDSDSTGAVTGNILGALLGYDAIPDHYKENLELRWLIEEIAEDLAAGVPKDIRTEKSQRWVRKYVELVDRDCTPIRNSYRVHDELNIFAGEYPGDKDANMCKIKVQDNHCWSKIRHFLDLTCEGELAPYAHFLKNNKCHRRFPIPDCGVPNTTADVARLCQEIIYLGQHGEWRYDSIYIHCWGGVGRTGTIVACLYAYLMRDKGLSSEEIYSRSMQQLQEAFSRCPKSKFRKSPENNMQREFVRKFIENECV